MPLSEREQKALEELEAQLAASDPRFATTMVTDPRTRDRRRRRLLGLAAVLVGLAVMGVSAYVHQPWIGAFGMGLIVMGLVFAVTDPGAGAYGGRPGQPHAGPRGQVRSVSSFSHGSSAHRPGQRTSGAKTPFMTRLEERWERRRNENAGW